MEMETYIGKGDLEMQAVQDQTVLYQLRRSSHKIEELMQEINRLRNDNSTQLSIITALQQQLKAVETARRHLQELVVALRQEIQTSQTQIQILKNKDELTTLESAFRILKKRYTNCQEENSILRVQLIEKDDEIQKIKENNRQLTEENQRLKQQVQALVGDLQLANNGLSDLRKLNSELEHSRSEWQLKYREIVPVLTEYESRFGLVDRELRQSQRAEEGWFCEFKDLRETVEHIQELRQNVRLKKIAKLHAA